MLEPTIKLLKENSICTCGKPNFRAVYNSNPLYKIYEVIIPTAPCGSVKLHLCEDCLKIIANKLKEVE